MEAVFDNNRDVVNARILATHDNSVLYTLKSTSGFRGRKVTLLRDANPGPGKDPGTVVGAIHWEDRVLEVQGVRKKFGEVKRREGFMKEGFTRKGLLREGFMWKEGFMRRSRHWRWAPERKEYEVRYDGEEWKATLDHNMMIAGRFCVPFRPHLFTKNKPAILHLTQTALAEDEVFLILVFVYSEAKRQDNTLCGRWERGVVGELRQRVQRAHRPEVQTF